MADVVPYGIIDPDYARIFTMARTLAWGHGYALLFHGSFTRDLDLIAVPWTAQACEPDHLIRMVAESADLNILGKANAEETLQGSPKEHGRRAWTLTFKAFADPRFIDFSIMPRITEAVSTRPEPPEGYCTCGKHRSDQCDVCRAAVGTVGKPS